MKRKVLIGECYIFGKPWIQNPLSTTPISFRVWLNWGKGLVMGKSYKDSFQKQSGTMGNYMVKTTARMSNQPKQSCVKKSLFGQIHHVALWLNHHFHSICQLRLQPLEIPWWTPLSELHLLVCTWPCATLWTTPVCRLWPFQFPADALFLLTLWSLHKIRCNILSWKGAGRY